ncbi:MAG TPA: M12 family metallo-peptidase [Actinomycetota bacterium]
MSVALLSPARRSRPRNRRIALVSLSVSILSALVVPAASAASAPSPRPLPAVTTTPAASPWTPVVGPLPEVRDGHPAGLAVDRFRAFTLDRARMEGALVAAPLELAAQAIPAEVGLPAPTGELERFSVWESPVMEPGLARRHPDMRTYVGEGITDPTATVRLSLTPLGFHASVRGSRGSWFIDPYYHLDQSVHVSYFGRDLENVHGPLVERGLERAARREPRGGEGPERGAEALAATGPQLRVYRLALVTDPSYSTYFDPGGTSPENVTAAKVVLVNRVTQIYEDETAIRMILVDETDRTNLDTAAEATEANGPCGAAACFTTAQLSTCGSGTLSRNRIVLGQLVGASDYDVGHIALGKAGGGIASLAVVGGNSKAQGCTGLPNPVGDFFAVDYVAHELGHQYAGNHTFNGNQANCSGGNRNGGTSVEPGSGSSIMAYAGICGTDDLQAHSDPYWSQRSFDEITAYVTSSRAAINEVQTASLLGFDTDGESFTLTYQGSTSAPIARGTTYSAPGIQAALAPILPAGATVSVAGFGGSGSPGDTGFQLTFGGSLAMVNVSPLTLTDPVGLTGFMGETAKGGSIDNQGSQVLPTGNSAPSVAAPAMYTIPYQTPFALTGSATDADGDTLTYMWEQNNAGSSAVGLISPIKTTGPLFRQFGTAQDAALYEPATYDSPGENHTTTDPTRVFPDMAQILANNTNAETADCPPAPANTVDCYSEFLPTPVYMGSMQFRLTARDGHPGGGGVNSANTTVALAPATGPFLVTSPNTAVTYAAGSTQTVTWNVAGTSLMPVGTTSVEILLSTDGGATFPHVLASSTPNDGSEPVTMPAADTDAARVMVRALGNVFFDVSNADFTIERTDADLEVSVTDDPDPAYAGESLDYAVTVRNNGPTDASDVQVVDTVPAGTSVQSTSVPCAESPSRTLTCDLGTMTSGQEVVVLVTVLVDRALVHDAGGPVTVTNAAEVSAATDDLEPANDTASEETLVKARADLEVVSVEVLNPPSQMLAGESRSVTIRSVIANRGAAAPMDARLTRSSSGGSVTPATSSVTASALGLDEDRAVDEEVQVACAGPGPTTFTFESEVAPDRADDEETDSANNSGQASFSVDCMMAVAINIKPGSFTNPVNPGSKGVIPVAILTTSAGEYGLPAAFDAGAVHPGTLRFGPEAWVLAGGGAKEAHGRGHLEDAIERSDETSRDGDTDMVAHFRTQESRLTGEVRACVRGEYGPEHLVFIGCDLVTVGAD